MNTALKPIIIIAASAFLALPANAAVDATGANGLSLLPKLEIAESASESAPAMLQVARNSTKPRRRAKPVFKFQPKAKIRGFKTRGRNTTAGPATIGCEAESSEECNKIVVGEPNCSTEHMQGDDIC